MKKLPLIAILICCNTCLFAQYNYGLEIMNQDAKIEGKLNLATIGNSVFVGLNSGIYDDGTNNRNTFVGYNAGHENIDGEHNVFIGYFSKAGFENLSGNNNVFIGTEAGLKNTTGTQNVFIGQDAGLHNLNGFSNVLIGHDAARSHETGNYNVSLGSQSAYYLTKGEKNTYLGYQAALNNREGDRNVFIGYRTGANEVTSDKLYIDNSDTARPLIYGDFSLDQITIHGTLHVTETAQLTPMEQPSSCNTIDEVGLLYFDRDLDAVYVCTRANAWQPLH